MIEKESGNETENNDIAEKYNKTEQNLSEYKTNAKDYLANINTTINEFFIIGIVGNTK